MDGAEPENQVAAVNGNDFAAGKKFRKSVERNAIVWIIEHRDEDEFVGDVKISVTGREPLPVKKNGCGHGKCLDAQSVSVLIFRGFEQGKIFLQRGIIRVGWIFFDDGDHRCWINETREIVYVAVGVVSGNAIF